MELKKNYGNNISIKICKKKYIIGIKLNICLVINMCLIFTFIISFWILLLYKLLSIYIFLFGIFLYCLLIYNYLKSFFTEPGIIPRNYSKYILNKNKNDYILESDNNLFKVIDNKTRSIIALNIEEPGLKNFEEIHEEKEKKIFPDFILAESNEDLKKNNIILNNSINNWYSNDNLNLKNMNKIEQKNVYKYSKKYKNNENGSIIKNNKENNNNSLSESYTPHIFTKRECNTCNIIRPPKTSHCVICDNCIMDMDHHCFYISNCIGIRNRKYFLLFLFFGFLLSILCIITSFYQIIFTLFIKNEYKNLNKLLYKKYYIPNYISLILMLIGVLILFIKKESLKISCAIFIPGNILFYIFFHLNKKSNSNYNIFEYHPFCISLIYIILPLFIFVTKYLKKQIKLIGKNLSTKQYMSIKEERNNNKNNKEIYKYLDSILKRKIELKNIFTFL